MTIPMPEPDIFDGTRLDGSIASHGYSAATLEAYAAAKVREALERAESQIMKMHDQAVKARVHPDQAEEGWNDSCADRAIALGEAVLAIRSIIPPLPGPVEPTT